MNVLNSDDVLAAEGSLRLFIALSFPDPVLDGLTALSSRLQKGAAFTGCKLRWTARDGFHLTLAFLGAQPVSQVETLNPLLAELARRFPPQRLELRGLGVFPHWKRPTVLWTAVRDRSHGLAALHDGLNRALAGLGFKAEDKPFRPHVTLARFKDYRNLAAIEKLAHDHRDQRSPTFETAALTLYQSRMHPDGAIHRPLAMHGLCGQPPTEKEPSDAGADAA